jgi:hypothetical protein
MLNNLFRKTSDGLILDTLVPIETFMSILPSSEVAAPRGAIYAVLALAKDTYGTNAIVADYESRTL